MSEVGAPAPAAPAAPSAPSASPSPSSADRGAPPKGHKWGPSAPAPVGQAPVPTQARRSAQEVSTGTPSVRQPAPVVQKPAPPADQARTEQRAARLEKFRTADGQDVEVDVGEFLEREMSSAKRKVKVNGQEREITIAEALERFPLAEGAHARFREAHDLEAKTNAERERVVRALEPLRDPTQALSVLTRIHGPQVAQKMMEDHLRAVYAREAMPADQRAALEMRERGQSELQTERQKFEQEREVFTRQQQEAQAQRFEVAKNTELTRIQRDFPILLRDAGLPVTPKSMARLAQAVSEARTFKIPYTEAQLAKQVAQELREEMGHFGEAADPESLRAMLGKGADKIRQAEVDRVMSQPGRGRPRLARAGALPTTIRTPDELRKHLRAQDLAAERRGR